MFQGYHPMGYTPGQPAPRPTLTPEPSEVTAGQKYMAIHQAHATHIAPDGTFCYMWRYGRVFEAQWYTNRYGGWWPYGEQMPADAIPIKAGL